MTKFIHASYSVWLLILGPLAFVFAIGPEIDRRFPVVEPFVISTIECNPANCVQIAGWLEKRRDCRLVELYARVQSPDHAIPRIVEVEFLDRPKQQKISRPVGEQFWGPWIIKAHDGDMIELRATHQCHPFWDTKSTIATFEVVG